LRNAGWKILSSTATGLSEAQRARAREAFEKPLDGSFTAGPAFERARGGWVNPKAPVTPDALATLPIREIVSKLKDDWSPARLRQEDTIEDFLHPLNAEGMGTLLKADLQKRPHQYLCDSELFFDRDVLHPHYTYAFFGGVIEAVRARRHPADADWGALVRLMHTIIRSGRIHAFDRTLDGRESGHSWLAGWDAVYRALGDLTEEMLKSDDDQPVVDITQYRDELLEVISELLAYPDPEPEPEGKSTSDPFTNAINSIRGAGIQALMWFMHWEGSGLPASETSRIAADVKAIYERTLSAENTQSMMFLFGHYLVPVYSRDRDWGATLFPRVFPADPEEHDLYLAAWEGYLTREPFGELLFHLVDYYQRALKIDPSRYTKRNYHTELDEGIATHLALAFIYAPEAHLHSDLLKLFWEIKNFERHENFVEFIGRHCVLRTEGESWTKTSSVGVKRLQDFWDWALEHCESVGVLAAFGYWMRADAGLFEREWLAKQIERTLEKTKGIIEWEHGMMESLGVLAPIAPVPVLGSIRMHLLTGRVDDPRDRRWVYVDDELIVIFRTLFRVPATKEPTRKLVNDLLPLGNGQFWRLKGALSD
jgi:hypothetical protein